MWREASNNKYYEQTIVTTWWYNPSDYLELKLACNLRVAWLQTQPAVSKVKYTIFLRSGGSRFNFFTRKSQLPVYAIHFWQCQLLQCTCSCHLGMCTHGLIPRPIPSFSMLQCATLKTGNGPGDEVGALVHTCLACLITKLMVIFWLVNCDHQ